MPSFCIQMKINDNIVFKQQLKEYHEEMIENIIFENLIEKFYGGRIIYYFHNENVNLNIMGKFNFNFNFNF